MSTAPTSPPSNGRRATNLDDFDDFVARLASELNVDLDGAAPEDRLVDDLGFDSIAVFELFVLLEDTASRELPLELVDSLETLADAWQWHATLAQQRSDASHLDTPRR